MRCRSVAQSRRSWTATSTSCSRGACPRSRHARRARRARGRCVRTSIRPCRLSPRRADRARARRPPAVPRGRPPAAAPPARVWRPPSPSTTSRSRAPVSRSRARPDERAVLALDPAADELVAVELALGRAGARPPASPGARTAPPPRRGGDAFERDSNLARRPGATGPPHPIAAPRRRSHPPRSPAGPSPARDPRRRCARAAPPQAVCPDDLTDGIRRQCRSVDDVETAVGSPSPAAPRTARMALATRPAGRSRDRDRRGVLELESAPPSASRTDVHRFRDDRPREEVDQLRRGARHLARPLRRRLASALASRPHHGGSAAPAPTQASIPFAMLPAPASRTGQTCRGSPADVRRAAAARRSRRADSRGASSRPPGSDES